MNLAIFTNKPAFNKPLYVGAPIVEKEVRKSYYSCMDRVFDRNYFTNNGPLVKRFEAEIAKLHRVKYCIAVCNATIGQILVLKALGLKGEIILPSFTFVATAHSCLWQNTKPVFCDIDRNSLMIDVNKVEELITQKTSAIIGVHLFGNICDVKKLANISKKYKLKLIFDAAHAFNCSLGNIPIGGFGNAEILSFHATKFFSTFEGGVVLTNDPKLNDSMKSLRNFGFYNYDSVGMLGINGKMTESSAAMGLASLQSIKIREKMLKKNYSIYHKYLCLIPGIKLLPVGVNGHSNYQYIVILIDETKYGVSRDILYYTLWKENVIVRRYFYPGCHRMEPYNTLYPNIYKTLPVTEDVTRKILCLPSNLTNPDRDILTIANIIKTIHLNTEKVLRWHKNHH